MKDIVRELEYRALYLLREACGLACMDRAWMWCSDRIYGLILRWDEEKKG